MIRGKPAGPPSPPTSPRMSGTATSDENQWQHTHDSSVNTPTAGQLPLANQNSVDVTQQKHPNETSLTRPPLRSHKSFPYSLGPSGRVQDANHQDAQSSTGAIGDFNERVLSQGPQPTASADLQRPTYGGSAPTSPAGRLTPPSPGGSVADTLMEDEELDFGTAEVEEGGEKRQMTAAELRAHKRKMKRFRLTHNQTRFLMSEFARQAHPDAAHRERLSREIPGLSPRQVQVWFQNRRAKLKRLTTDDRERMMRSRALPAGFDMTQALHAPFGAPTPNASTPVQTPGSFAPASSNSGAPPLTLDTFKHPSSYNPYGQHFSAQTGITPTLGGLAFTPPQSATDTMSPASAASNVSGWSFQTQESPRRQPFGLPSANQSAYGGYYSQVPRPHNMHDRFARAMGEAAGSPLRTSMSYTGLSSMNAQHAQAQDQSQSSPRAGTGLHGRPRTSRSTTNPSVPGNGLYGLGFSYPQVPGYQQLEQAQQPSNVKIEGPRYRRSSSHLAGPPLTYNQYPPTNFTAPLQQYPHFGGQIGSNFFQQSFQPRVFEQQNAQEQVPPSSNAATPQTYSSVLGHGNQFITPATEQEHELGDNSDGGVPLPPTY